MSISHSFDMMASSAHKQQQQQQLPNMYGTTAAPPPTPSTQPNIHMSSSTAAADALSRLLHRLPPTLSLPTRRSPPTKCPTLISLSDPNPNDLLSFASQLGFFQLTNHSIPSQLANSAELESLSLFELTKDQKESYFPKNWPLGFDADDDEDGDGCTESFCIDSTSSNESTELSLSSLREFTQALEKTGLKLMEMIASAVGFENPVGEDPTRFCSLMWVSEGFLNGENPVVPGGFYPYIVGLQYQIRTQKYSLLGDSGWVSVSPQVDSIMVTLGDIAQVWSNGKLKKVRGRPVPCLGDGKNSRCITMSLLVTLPTDSDQVSPLIPKVVIGGNDNEIKDDEEQNNDSSSTKKEQRLFNSFSFEDYAWRVYHERLLFKDPLDRYRI